MEIVPSTTLIRQTTPVHTVPYQLSKRSARRGASLLTEGLSSINQSIMNDNERLKYGGTCSTILSSSSRTPRPIFADNGRTVVGSISKVSFSCWATWHKINMSNKRQITWAGLAFFISTLFTQERTKRSDSKASQKLAIVWAFIWVEEIKARELPEHPLQHPREELHPRRHAEIETPRTRSQHDPTQFRKQFAIELDVQGYQLNSTSIFSLGIRKTYWTEKTKQKLNKCTMRSALWQ